MVFCSLIISNGFRDGPLCIVRILEVGRLTLLIGMARLESDSFSQELVYLMPYECQAFISVAGSRIVEHSA